MNQQDAYTVKGAIFDMDGVLIDSQPLHFQSDIQVLAACGVTATLLDVKPYTGMSNPDRWPRYAETFHLTQSVAEIIAIQERIIMELFSQEPLLPVEGVNALLQLLSSNGLKMAVASSSSLALIRLVLDRLGQSRYFSEIISGEEVAAGKPAPDIFHRAAAKLGLANAECIVVEDSENGVAAAYNAGIRCIAYRNPTTGNQDLSKATTIIDSFHAINKDLAWL